MSLHPINGGPKPDFFAQRYAMVERLKKGFWGGYTDRPKLTNPLVIKAMLEVPREEFLYEEDLVANYVKAKGVADINVLKNTLEKTLKENDYPPLSAIGCSSRDDAYGDDRLGIGFDQVMSTPNIIATMTSLLDLTPSDIVREIGTGTGYQSGILSRIARHVDTIELVPILAEFARSTYKILGYNNIDVLDGDGSLEPSEKVQYNAIIFTALAPAIPSWLAEHLADNGRAVIPIAKQPYPMLTLYRKRDGKITYTEHGECFFVPLRGKLGLPKEEWY